MQPLPIALNQIPPHLRPPSPHSRPGRAYLILYGSGSAGLGVRREKTGRFAIRLGKILEVKNYSSAPAALVGEQLAVPDAGSR